MHLPILFYSFHKKIKQGSSLSAFLRYAISSMFCMDETNSERRSKEELEALEENYFYNKDKMNLTASATVSMLKKVVVVNYISRAKERI